MNAIYEYITQQLHTNQFFSAAFAASILGAAIVYFKSIPIFIYKQIKRQLIYTVNVYQNDPLFYSFEVWFFSHYSQRYREVEASTFERISMYGEPLPPVMGREEQTSDKVYYRQHSGIFFIRYKGKRLMIEKDRSKLDNAKDFSTLFMNTYTISGVFAREVIDDLLLECLAIQNKKNNPKEVKIYDNNLVGDWNFNSVLRSKSMDNVYMPDELKQSIKDDLDDFIKNKQWYYDASVFYKRGYVLEGPPGNGKTSLALAIADYTGRNVYSLDVSVLCENGYLKKSISSVSDNSILLIEDIDGIFNGREPINETIKINFSSFLNCLDGAFYREGLITIITTNFKEKMDPALLRKGRMDMVIHIPKPGEKEINKYLTAFYGQTHIIDLEDTDWSMCDVQDICMRNRDNPFDAVSELKKIIKSNY